MGSIFSIFEPISNIFFFILFNGVVCGISIHWVVSKLNGTFSKNLNRIFQNLALVASIFVIAIIFIKQWNIGDLLAFYALFSAVLFSVSIYFGNKEVIKETRGWFINIFLIFFIRGYFYEPYQIPSQSMRPNLNVGDFVLVNRFAYGYEVPFTNRSKVFHKDPEIGEIVVFFPPHKPNTPFVKRVIAKGGDTVKYVNKKIYINGLLYQQENISKDFDGANIFNESNGSTNYLIRKSNLNFSRNSEWVVPEGSFFVVGDNRDNSSDSRAWGFVSGKSIWGRADYIWLTWESWSDIPKLKFEELN